jgi:hypothetical protein
MLLRHVENDEISIIIIIIILKRKTKCQLYKTVILPTVLDGSESSTHEALLGVSERKILRRIYGAVQTDGVWRRRYNKKL